MSGFIIISSIFLPMSITNMIEFLCTTAFEPTNLIVRHLPH